MSKFVVQILLSVTVGISAALGFNPHMTSRLHETWQEVGAYLHETTNVAFRSTDDLKTGWNTGIAVQAVSKSAVNSSEKVNLIVKGKIKDSNQNSILGSLLPAFSLNSSASTQMLTGGGADTPGADTKLTEKITSTSHLNLVTGQ